MSGLLVVMCGVSGLCVGSFLNVVIWRVPRGGSVVSPPSHCPTCGHGLTALENVPVLSWLVLGGRCRSCRQPISARYPLVEAGTGLLYAWLATGVVLGWTAGAALPALLAGGAGTLGVLAIAVDLGRIDARVLGVTTALVGALLVIPGVLEPDGAAVIRGYSAALVLAVLIGLTGRGWTETPMAALLPVAMLLGWSGWNGWVVTLGGALSAMVILRGLDRQGSAGRALYVAVPALGLTAVAQWPFR